MLNLPSSPSVHGASRFPQWLRAFVLGVAATLALAVPQTAHAARERPADVAAREGRYLMVIGADPQTLDPHVATGFPEYQVFIALLEGLTVLDPVTNEPRPGVAEKWERSADGLTWVFHLRPARWSNGDPVVAEDFVYSMRRILTPALGSEYAYFLHHLKNGRAFNEKKITDPTAIGVRAIDAHTLEITLEHPVPYFLGLLTHQAYMPVHRASVEAAGRFDDRTSPWATPGKFVGNGPFALKSRQMSERIVAERNPHYVGPFPPKLQAVEFIVMESAQTADAAFRAGQVHVTDTLPLTRVPAYRAEKNPNLRTAPFLSTSFLLFNTTKPPFNDVRVRQALSLAIDRARLTERVQRGGERPAENFVPPGTGGYPGASRTMYDPERARQLLKEAGFPGGAGLPRIDSQYPTNDRTRSILEALQEMWRRELGVNVELGNVEWKVFLDSLTNRTYQIGFMAWVGDYIDPNTFLSMMLSDSGNNRTNWASPKYDGLLNRAEVTLDPAARTTLLLEAEAVLMDELPIVPLWHSTRNYLLHPAVRGFTPNVMDLHAYNHIWFEVPAEGK